MTKRKLFEQDPKLIQRWVKIRFSSFASPIARFYMRPILHFKERKRIREIEKSVDSTLLLVARCKKEGYSDTLVVANAALYLLLAELDIAMIKVDALTHPHAWKRKLYIRLFVLTAFERNIHHVFGRSFRDSVERLGCEPSLLEALTKELREFRRTHEKLQYRYKYYRDETIAHRESDAISTHKAIKNLRETDFIQSVAEVYPSIEGVLNCVTQILLKHGNVEALRKFSKNNKNL